MAKIEWNDSNLVGIDTIDQQHLEWLSLYNELEKLFLEIPASEQLHNKTKLLKELVEFTYTHFKEEERILYEADYPEIEKHRRMHEQFHQLVYQQYRKIEEGDIILTSQILNMIKTWFLTHTSTEDTKAFQFVTSKK